MQTETHSIHDVLSKNATSFFIPPFQRAYAWGKNEIERYFSDIERIINSELDKTQADKLEHFFGTLVIKEEKAGFVNKSIIVDGQQRLTTTLIFLIALRDNESGKNNQDYINSNYLTNNASTFQDKIKLKQVTKDWEAYRALVNHTEVQPGIIKNAYDIFYKMISDLKKAKPEIQLEQYILAIQRINVAVIFLDERPFKGEDPQIIFETLNSLGKPLTLSDLIRNYVLLNMDSNNQSIIYVTIWYPKIEQLLKDSSSDFFRDFLQYKTVSSVKAISDNNTKEIYSFFKAFVEESYSDHKLFIDDIEQYVKLYTWIIQEDFSDEITSDKSKNNEIKELLRNIFQDIKSEAFKPFVMGLLYYHQNKEDVSLCDDGLISILLVVRTYLIRRRLTKLTQGENKSIILLCGRIKELVQAKVDIVSLLSRMFYKVRLPNDDEMRQMFSTSNFYEDFPQYRKFVLGKIEEQKTKVSVDFRDPKITIEHIMPQTLNDDWENDLGESYDEVHKTYVHNIGNLILTEFNSEMGNKSFREKKEKLETSSLSYRIEVLKNDVWNEDAIKQHQKIMIDLFLETFPLPEEYRKASNWNTNEKEVSVFSPLDEDVTDWVEGNKPLQLSIGNNSFKVSTWQDVFIKFIKYLFDKKGYEFQYIIENQSELFSKEDTIVKWAELEGIFEKNDELRGRYKTLEGLFWNKVPNLTKNILFVHTNISASRCVTRIANVMNKFNIPSEVVKISLK